MIYKVGLLGASGRMGFEIAALLSETDGIELSDAIVDKSRLRSIEGVETRALQDPEREPVHLWIDFSHPSATIDLLEKIKTPIVIGTTGFNPHQRERILEYATRHPVLLSSNMSPGIFLLKKLIEQIPSRFKELYRTTLIEHHHDKKKDAPSGTALSLVESLKKVGWEENPIHSIRLGGEMGIHTLKLSSSSESITFEHHVGNRRLFAEGAILAGMAILKQSPGLYGMEVIFNDNEH